MAVEKFDCFDATMEFKIVKYAVLSLLTTDVKT